MNIMPDLHLALVSIPKLADAWYTTLLILTKDGTAIYNNNTTAITASNPPILKSNRCQHTGMWRLNLDPENPGPLSSDEQHVNPKTINVILWSPKLTRNISLVPRIIRIPTKRNIHQRRPQQKLWNMAKTNGEAHQPLLPWFGRDSKRTFKRPTPRYLINKAKSIGENYRKQEGQDQDRGRKITFLSHPTHQSPWSFLLHREDLSNSIHNDQTGAFPFTSQQGNRYIMMAIHLDANYIFVEPMRSRSKEEMINNQQNEIGRTWTQETHLGQQSLGGLQKMHPRTTDAIQTGPPGQSPTQPGRAHSSNVQSALHLNSSRSWWQVPTLPVVPPPWTNQTYFEPTMPIEYSTQDITPPPKAHFVVFWWEKKKPRPFLPPHTYRHSLTINI